MRARERRNGKIAAAASRPMGSTRTAFRGSAAGSAARLRWWRRRRTTAGCRRSRQQNGERALQAPGCGTGDGAPGRRGSAIQAASPCGHPAFRRAAPPGPPPARLAHVTTPPPGRLSAASSSTFSSTRPAAGGNAAPAGAPRNRSDVPAGRRTAPAARRLQRSAARPGGAQQAQPGREPAAALATPVMPARPFPVPRTSCIGALMIPPTRRAPTTRDVASFTVSAEMRRDKSPIRLLSFFLARKENILT